MQRSKIFRRVTGSILFIFIIAYAHIAIAAGVGEFINDVKIYKNNADKYAVFYPDGHLNNKPVILFLSGAGASTPDEVSSKYKGLLRYIASQGYYVIAIPYQGSYLADLSIASIEKALVTSRQYHPELDFSSLGVMGHSVGGGQAFPVIKHFLDANQNYGKKASFVLSIDGWFPFGMQQDDLRNLHTTASIIQFGGEEGTGTDPKIHITTMNLLPQSNKKSYHVLGDATGHSYLTGDLDNILGKQDLLEPIQSLLDYTFAEGNGDFLVSYTDTIAKVLAAIENHDYWDDCLGGGYGAKSIFNEYNNDINYCDPESYANPTSTLAIVASNVEVIDDNSVYIHFNLNEKAQARIEYGETTAYGHFTNKETSFNYATHRQFVANLDSSTLYHYRVHAYDKKGVEVISDDQTFIINPQPTLTIESSSVESINDSSVYVYFDLNEKAQARVEYGETTNYGHFTNKETSFNYASHRQQISDLNANTLYHYRVHAYDKKGVEVISDDKTFRINSQSTLEIKSSAVETINTSSVYIFFNLNEKAQARVEYGETTNYGRFTNKETSFDYDTHRQQISRLNANTLYHYRIHAYDRKGVEVISNDKTFIIKQSAGYAYPPETVFQLLSTNNDVAQPETRGSSVIDPEFGTTITRVTDARIVDKNGSSCTGYTYPKTQSWNADMSLLRVKYRLYDADTLEESPITKGLTCSEGYNKLGSPGEAIRWSYKNPNVFYSLKTNSIFQKNTINGNSVKHEIVRDFSEYGFERMLLGSNEGNMSYDDKLVIFTARKPENDHVFAVLLNTETKGVKVKELPNTTWGTVFVKKYQRNDYDERALYDWITISPKGDHILENKTVDGDLYIGQYLENAPDKGIFMYDLNFENPQRISMQASHGDIGIDANGDQVWVQFEYGGDRSGTWSYNLDTLEDRLVGKKLFPYKAGHISCQNYNRPGWCYLSTTSPRRREVYALKLDGSAKVNRFAQTRYKYSSYGGVSPDGKRVVFQSDWNQGGKLDTYHAALKTNTVDLNTNVLYEDAEDGNTNNWSVYDETPTGATISNVFDADKGSQVIKLQGSATQNGYKLGGNWNNSERKSIQWKMKYDERFVVYISVNTSKGHRYIYYSSDANDYGFVGNKYIHHGLGESSIDATWRIFTRDLAADLKDYEDDNNLLSINGFLIRGSGLVDDIQLLQ